MNITLEASDPPVELFRQRSGAVTHALASKDFSFATGSESAMLRGEYHVYTVCGERYKYGRYSEWWMSSRRLTTRVMNVCEYCFYN